MSSEASRVRSLLRRWAPWGLYALATAAVVPLHLRTTGFSAVPAEAEVRRVVLSGPRTSHRLRVEEVRVAPGDAVVAGQVLARMESAELDAELAGARRRLEELELEVAAVEGRRRDDHALASSQLERQAALARIELARLSAEEDRDRSELTQLEATLAQEERLVADRLSSLERVEDLRLRRAGLTAKLARLRWAVEQAGAGADAASRHATGWGGAPASAARVGDEGAPARAAAGAQRELVRQLEAVVARLELRAPFDGRVEQVLLRPGETAGADGAVLAMVDDRPRGAVAWVEQLHATRVRPGDRVRLVPRDGSGPALAGRVAALGPAITALPSRFSPVPGLQRWGRPVYVELERPAALPGQAFEATFHRAPGSER